MFVQQATFPVGLLPGYIYRRVFPAALPQAFLVRFLFRRRSSSNTWRMHGKKAVVGHRLLVRRRCLKPGTGRKRLCIGLAYAAVLFWPVRPLVAQTLSVTTGTSSTSGWSISNQTLLVTANCTVNIDEINNALAAGSLTIKANGNLTARFYTGAHVSCAVVGHGLTIGTPTNMGNIQFDVDISLAGPISVMGQELKLFGNIITTASGDMLFQGLGNNWSIRTGSTATIGKTAGTGVLTMQTNGRINDGTNAARIEASGSARLDVVIISEMDAGSSGAYPVSTGPITTNGGHLWVGGGAKTQTWNGLDVGSSGSPSSANFLSGVEITGNISTNGGDILLWGHVSEIMRNNGYGDIAARGIHWTVDAGSGNITLLTRYSDYKDPVGRKINLKTTGTISLAPGSGAAYDLSALSVAGTTAGTAFTGSDDLSGLVLPEKDHIGELVIGTYAGTGLPGDTEYVPANHIPTVLSASLDLAGNVSVHASGLTVNQHLGSATAGDISLIADALSFGSGITVSAAGMLTIAPKTTSLSIGVAGATGTLQVPVSFFSNNFTDGFSNIRIGRDEQTGDIAIGAFNLQDDLSFQTNGDLTLEGIPVLGSSDVTLGTAIQAVNLGSPANYFQTDGAGAVIRSVDNGSTRLFPVGRAAYNPVSIANKAGAADIFSARVFDAVFQNGSSGTQTTAPHVSVTWDIHKSNPNSGAGVDFEFGWHSFQESGPISSHQLNHHDGIGWEFAAGSSLPPSGTDFKTMLHAGYTGPFSPFAIGQTGTALPATLLALRAECLGKGVRLSWQTAAGTDTRHMEVMRSDDGLHWHLLATVAAVGTTDRPTDYLFTDSGPLTGGPAYYRLSMVDLDGRFEFSPVATANCDRPFGSVSYFPNPAYDKVTIRFVYHRDRILDWVIAGAATGQVVFRRKMPVIAGDNILDLPLPELPGGSYYIRSAATGPVPLLICR